MNRGRPNAVCYTYFLTALAVWLLTAPGRAQELNDTLIPYAVNVHRTPVQSWPGYGIYLGRGYFLTAAHVVGPGWLTRPKIVALGKEYATTVVKEGSFEGTDLTLVSVDEALLPLRFRLRRSSLCKAPPVPGQRIVTVVPEGIAYSQVVSPSVLPPTAKRFNTAIADVARTGNSGSGVFDAERRCLLGIMSRKISRSIFNSATRTTEVRDIAKYFVPAGEIAMFLPPGSPY